MYKDIYASELQRNYKKVIDSVRERGVPYIVTKRNKPQAAIVPMKLLNDYRKIKEEKELEEVLKIVKKAEEDYKKGNVTKFRGIEDFL